MTDGAADRSGVRISVSAAAGAPAASYAAVPVHDASVSGRAAAGDSAAGDSAAGDSPVWPAAVSDRHAPAFACDAAGAPRRPAAPADTMREDDLTACGRERTAAPADTMREDDLTACGREQTTASAAAMRKEDPTSGGGADPPDSEARFRRISARMSREELEEAYVTLRVREERIRQVLE